MTTLIKVYLSLAALSTIGYVALLLSLHPTTNNSNIHTSTYSNSNRNRSSSNDKSFHPVHRDDDNSSHDKNTHQEHRGDNSSHDKNTHQEHRDDNSSHDKNIHSEHRDDDNSSHDKNTHPEHRDDNSSHDKNTHQEHRDNDNSSHDNNTKQEHRDDNSSHDRNTHPEHRDDNSSHQKNIHQAHRDNDNSSHDKNTHPEHRDNDNSSHDKNTKQELRDDTNKTTTNISSSSSSNATTTTTTSNSTKGFLVYVCDSRRSCGGWGDRQRGLMGVFLLSFVTRRRFVLVMTKPCDVIQHYEPPSPPRGGAAGWRVDPEVLRAAALISNVSVDDMGSRLGLSTRLGGGLDFNRLYPQNVVFIRTNGEYWLGLRKSKLYKTSLPAWAMTSRAVYFAEGWSRLMTPSRSLQARLDEVLARMHFRDRKRPLVCAHVRVGRSATLKRDSAVRCNISTLPVLWTFLRRWVDNGSDVFLATDSYAARNLTRHHFGARMLDTGEAIVHVDQLGWTRDAACRGFQSALLDQLILARCDVLVTSHSVFSQRAAFLRGKSDHLYSFLNGKITKYGL